jgi:tetratricopeptide (TPR) repeat protein
MKEKIILRILTGILIPLFFLISLSNGFAGRTGSVIPISCSAEEAIDLFLDGREAFEMGRMSDATHFLDNALKLDGSFALAWLYKAYMSDNQDEWIKFIEKASACSENISEGEALLIKLEKFRAEDKNAERLELAKRLASLYPDCPHALLTLAAEYQAAGDHTRFRDLAAKAIVADKDSPLAYRTLAASFLLNQPLNFTLAREYILKFAELRPAEPASFIALGDVYRAEFDMSDAIDAYSRAISLDPNSAITYVKRGYANIYSGNFDNPRLDFALARDLASKGSNFFCPNIGIISYLDPGNCITELPSGLRNRDPQIMTEINRRGKSLDHQFCCSVVAMKHGIFSPPDQSCDGCTSLKNQLLFESVLPGPDLEEASITFMDGYIAAENGNFERAEKMKNRFAELADSGTSPRKIEVCNYLEGLINLNQNKFEEAVYYYNKCDKTNPCVKFDLALAYMGMGDIIKAKEALREIVEIGFSGYCKPPMANYAVRYLEKFAALPAW